MVTTHSSWHKARFPFLWYRVSGVLGDGNVLIHAKTEYRFSRRGLCDHDWLEQPLHGDVRLELDGTVRRQCMTCGKIEIR